MNKIEKYNLLDNAYNFINESLANARKSKRTPTYWTFSILHLIQGLELLMKDLLRKEHPILIFENVDHPKNSVNLAQALNRLISIVSVDIDEKETKIIKRASTIRNKIVHFEYELNPIQFKAIYLQLFEFTHYFYHKHIGQELHEIIDEKLWRIEAEFLSEFGKNEVTYRGRKLHKSVPLDIVDGQKYNMLRMGMKNQYKYFERIKYGNEPNLNNVDLQKECPDCYVFLGEYHAVYCDIEICPICAWQLLSCKCDTDYWIKKQKI